ncbi:MAG: serine/threonine-protein kinase [Verrucomicrobiota bacterium]
MSGERQSPNANERDIFLEALEQPTAQERAAYLDCACGGDRLLRGSVEALLQNHKEDNFLETPAVEAPQSDTTQLGPSGTVRVSAMTEKAGDRIGRYKLLQEIGEGGCGTVYMAEQEEPVRRRVALKVIKLGMDTKSVIARFEAERQALAMMDHPNIAKVFDAGATETGRPYFVMELVRGIRINEYCDQNKLPTRERLDLFIKVCQAIQHAHQKGIIHRDIKPSNILVTLHDGVPVPKVIDFGIAKATGQRLTDKTVFTEFQAFVGTPAYTSPEQVEMSGLDIDTRTDIYSLGVLLYELLTGKTPFDAKELVASGLEEMRRTIREQEPLRPSTLLRTMLAAEITSTANHRQSEPAKLATLMRGDLDWIVMQSLEKDRTRRYATANELAMDIQRYLGGEPVLARPASNLYRFQKFVRRHRGAIAAAAGITATLLTGITISMWQAVRATKAEHRALEAQQQETQLRQQAEQERERAEQEKASARLNEYVADINLAQQSLSAGNFRRAMELVNKHRPQPGEPDLRGFEWRYLWQLCQGDDHAAFPTQDGTVQSMAISPGGGLLAIGLREKLNIWDIRTKALVAGLPKGAVSMSFFPDGKTLVTASFSTVRVWRTGDWSEQTSLPENSGPIALSRDATRLATASREGVRIWDTSTWKEERLLTGASGPVVFSPDGETLATDAKEGITLWRLRTGRAELVLQDSTNVFTRGGRFRSESTFAFSPDGKSVVAARNTLTARGVFVLSIWDAQSGKEIAVMPSDRDRIEHDGFISSLAFSPDGRTLATGSRDHSIRLWDFDKRQRLVTLHGNLSEVWAVVFSPDGQTLVSGAKDGGVKLWATRRQQKEDTLPGAWQPLALSKDSRTLAALSGAGSIAFLNLATGESEQQFPLEGMEGPRRGFGFRPAVAMSGDLRTLAQGLDDGTVRLRNTETGDITNLKASDSRVEIIALSPDSRILITGGRDQNLRWWDLRHHTNTVLATEAYRVLFSPDGRTLAAFQRGDNLQLWDITTPSLRTNLVSDTQPGPGSEAAFSPDGRILAVAGSDDAIHMLDVATGRLLGTFTGHKQPVFSVAFSPDGKTLATASDDSTMKLWNVATQQELLSLRRLGGVLRGLMFTPDGRLLVGGSSFSAPSGGLRFYRAPLLSETDTANAQTGRKTEHF